MPPPVRLEKVTCISASDTKERKRNMRWCMGKEQGFKRITELVSPASKHHIAIIGGGPSLNETYKGIEQFDAVMSCGSSHDHAIRLGIKSTYHLECDPSTEQLKNYRRANPAIKYLVSSRCHRGMFKRMRDNGNEIYLWHMWEGDLGKPIYHGEPAFICGATCVLSAIPIALTLGYKHLHFFGFDSSFKSREEHHAYPQAESATMMEVTVGDPINGRKFQTTATWIAQVQQFEDMRNNWPFECTIYGDSLTAEMEKERAKELAIKNSLNQTKLEGVAA